MSDKIVLSICMPTYNRASHIKRQLRYFESEMEEELIGRVEIIISNNASTDNTEKVLSLYDGKYSWLSINNNETNIGGHANMQLLLSMANGIYIWIPGDDDYLKKGLVKRIVSILETESLTYLYLSRRTIEEQTKTICLEGKTHNIRYNIPINVSQKELANLVRENFSDLKFQTSSVFLRSAVLVYNEEVQVYSKEAGANCHSLFRAIRSMQDGQSFFMSDISVLSGNEITWGDCLVDYLSIYDAEFSRGLVNWGFTKRECNRICDRQLAAAVAFFLTHKDVMRTWRKKGMPGWSIRLIPNILFLGLRKCYRKFGWSKTFRVVDVRLEDFI